MKITIDLSDILATGTEKASGTIRSALAEKCEESDSVACGTIGMEFATSGPGPGWSTTFGVSDFAARALAEEYGATHYLDLDDGKVATMDEDGDVVWSDESCVEIVVPDEDDVLAHPEVVGDMARAAIEEHAAESDVEAWKKLVLAVRAAADAFDGVDAE